MIGARPTTEVATVRRKRTSMGIALVLTFVVFIASSTTDAFQQQSLMIRRDLSSIHSLGSFGTFLQQRKQHVSRSRSLMWSMKDPTTVNVESSSSSSNDEDQQQQKDLFDPLDFSSSSSSVALSKDPLVSQQEEELDSKDNELGLWASRAILLLVAAIWGTNFASVKYLESLCFFPPCNHPPSEFAFARFGVAALVSLPLLLRQRWDIVMAGLECGIWISLGYMTQALALSYISAGKCAFICSLTVVFVPVVSTLIYGKPMKMGNIAAGLVAICGVAVIEGMIDVNSLLMGVPPAVAETAAAATSNMPFVEASTEAVATTTVTAAAAVGPLAAIANSIGVSKGVLLALGQPVGFGYAFTRIEHVQEKFKDVPNRVLTIAAAQCVMVGFLSSLWVLYDYNWVFPDFGYMMEIHRVAAIAWTGVVTTVFAIFLEGIALQKASATDASIAFSTEPVWASMFGFLLLQERLGVNVYVGGFIIMLACLVATASDLLGPTDSNEEVEQHQAAPIFAAEKESTTQK